MILLVAAHTTAKHKKKRNPKHSNDQRMRLLEAKKCVRCCGDNPRWPLQYCDNCKGTVNEQLRLRRVETRQKLLDEYGAVCNCCGEMNPVFLTLDHVNNDGYLHRREGYRHYFTIIDEGCPKDKYQILCFNCNCGKQRNGGICPHKN